MLTPHEQDLLALAGAHYKYEGAREHAALTLHGLSATRFWQDVNRIIDSEAAVAHAPALVARLRAKRKPGGTRIPQRLPGGSCGPR